MVGDDAPACRELGQDLHRLQRRSPQLPEGSLQRLDGATQGGLPGGTHQGHRGGVRRLVQGSRGDPSPDLEPALLAARRPGDRGHRDHPRRRAQLATHQGGDPGKDFPGPGIALEGDDHGRSLGHHARVGDQDRSAAADPADRLHEFLDIRGVDVATIDDHHVLEAPGDEERAVRQDGQVPGPQPALAQHLRRALRVAPVAAGDVRPAQLQLALLARARDTPFGVDDPELDARQRCADRDPLHAVDLQGLQSAHARHRHAHGGLGEAIHGTQGREVEAQLTAEAAQDVGSNGLGANSDDPHGGEVRDDSPRAQPRASSAEARGGSKRGSSRDASPPPRASEVAASWRPGVHPDLGNPREERQEMPADEPHVVEQRHPTQGDVQLRDRQRVRSAGRGWRGGSRG